MKEERDDSLAFEGVLQNVTPDKRGLGGGGEKEGGGKGERGRGKGGGGERDDKRVAWCGRDRNQPKDFLARVGAAVRRIAIHRCIEGLS